MKFLLKYLFLCIIFLCAILDATMGDSSALNAKNVNFYGTLETYSGGKKNVEYIAFWNRNTKTHVFEAPDNLHIIAPSDKRIELTFNPAKKATIATIELREIKRIEVSEKQPLFTYTEKNKISQNYIIVNIIFHGAQEPNYYLVPENEKMYVKQETGNELIEKEVPVISIKKLEINGFHIEDKETR